MLYPKPFDASGMVKRFVRFSKVVFLGFFFRLLFREVKKNLLNQLKGSDKDEMTYDDPK